MSDRPTRRDLLRPVQLLGVAFACALFAGGVTFVTTGGFQSGPGTGVATLPLTAIVAGVTFIVVLLGLSLLLLAVDPAQVSTPLDRPVLHDPDDAEDASADHSPSGSEPNGAASRRAESDRDAPKPPEPGADDQRP
ncbi:amino acid transporter [Microbacterium sp. LRZ72]|uniref:amino acid transporter n=1 Tax=Microbacterium sp. LRZ72 TaxID=2942481 RepID=UPI0029A9F041|nr:amino acid transporter [Microbacterium sp. LRZ72]MDX2376152.1 amino acid transporter [Microbacterium sp. LRZ72]